MARRKDLEGEIQQQMVSMIAQVVLFNHAATASLGLGASDSQFLTLLRTRGPMSPGQLAEASGLTSGTVTGVIDRLEKAKLVRRKRDSGDRRKVLVVPTADAVDRLSPIYAGQAALLSDVLAHRTPAELEAISSFLGDLIAEEETHRVAGAGASVLPMSECPTYRPDFLDEQVGLFPGGEVATTRRFTPVHDVAEASLGHSTGGTGHLPREHRAAGGHVDPVTDGVGEPFGDFVDALPVKPC